jgi:nucleoside-diphosphate-sugar epimerase
MVSTVLVTGAAGFVGSHLCEELLDRGYEVRGVDAFIDYYPRAVKEANVLPLVGRSRFTLAVADLRTADLVGLLDGVDVVVHAAAMPGLPRSWTDFVLYQSCNVLATQRLAEAACATAVSKLVYVSTSSVYGVDACGDETLATQPVSPYGVTKLAAEHLLGAYAASRGLPVCVLRYFSVYGPRQRPDMAYHRFVEAMLDGRPLTVHGDGTQTRSSTYVTDCVAGTVAAVERARPGEVFNVGGGQVISVLEVISILEAVLGVRAEVRHTSPRPGDQRRTAANTAKARRLLGYVPEVGPLEGLTAQARWQIASRDIAGARELAG